MNKYIRKIIPLLFIILLVVIFFWKFFIKKLYPIPSDIIVGMYFPWLDSHWGYFTGVPVKNNLLSDIVSQFWIWRNLAIDLLSSGQNPFWNSFSLSGTPLSPVLHSSLFYPLNLFYLVFNRVLSMGLIVIMQPLLAVSFMFILLKKYNLNFLSSLFGGVIFGFCGFMMVWLEWGTIGHTLLWLPLLLYITECYLTNRKFMYLLLLAISLGLSFTAGHLQTFFYCFSLWFIYFIYRCTSKRLSKPLVPAITVSLLFFSLFAFLIIPTTETILLSIRSADKYISQNNFGFLPYFNLITYFAPDYLGNPVTNNWWGKMFNYQELVAYFGLIPLILALSSYWVKDTKIHFWKILFVFSLLLSLEYPFGWLIYTLKIPFLSTASASRILCINAFSGAILAAYAFDHLLTNKTKLPSKMLIFSWIVLLGYSLATAMSYLLVYRFDTINHFEGEAGRIVITYLGQMKTGLRNMVIPICLLLLTTLAIYTAQKLTNWRKIRLSLLCFVCALTLFELFRFGWKYNPFIRADLYFPKTEITEKLGSINDYSRIERERGELLPPNMWISYGLYSSSGYDPVYPRNYSKFLSLLSDNKASNEGIGRYAEIDNYQSPLFDYLGVKYILALKRNEKSVIDPLGKTSYKFAIDKLTPIFDSGSMVILENKQTLPKAFFINKTVTIKDDLKAGNKIIEIGKDIVSTAVISEPLQGKTENDFSPNDGKVEINNYQSGRIEIQTEKTSVGFLVLSDTYYPGWKAYVDGKQTKIYRVNLSFRGVLIPPGKHGLLFVYQPMSYVMGCLISAICYISLLIWLLKLKVIKIRKVTVKNASINRKIN